MSKTRINQDDADIDITIDKLEEIDIVSGKGGTDEMPIKIKVTKTNIRFVLFVLI